MSLSASLTQVLRLDDASQVGHARRVVQKLAEQQGFDAADAGRAALVATELASNVLKHAACGELHLRVLAHGGQPGIELLTVDRGHGFDLANCLIDGYSTGGTQGIGLGAVSRLAQVFDVHTDAHGSVVLARVYKGGTALRGMFRPIVDMGSVDLIFEEPHGLPKMYTDDKKLAQILRNFISNALKFTTRGEVRVSAHLQGNDQIRFAVSDTGIGIAPELLGGLFEDFAQIDSPLQKRLRGTGLGLSLCKRFAALLGGEVGVDSVPGEGSSFFVIIPLALAQESADEP